MRSAPRDNPSGNGDIVLERTAGQTLWWFLRHPVSVTVIIALLGAGVVVPSAIVAGSTPLPTRLPRGVTDSTAGSRPVEATVAIECPAGAELTIKASGSGDLELTIGGPTPGRFTGTGTVAATVTGPAGTYTATATASGQLDRLSWSSTVGRCSE